MNDFTNKNADSSTEKLKAEKLKTETADAEPAKDMEDAYLAAMDSVADITANDDNEASSGAAKKNIDGTEALEEADGVAAKGTTSSLGQADIERKASLKQIELEKKIADLEDKYVRAQAEIQNIHRRSLEEQKKAREYAITSFAKELVTVKDYLEMALKDESGNFDGLKMGVDLTLKQLQQVFANHKIKEVIPKASDKLDPHLHQAMESVEAENQEQNTIVKVMQKGYILNDRVLRPAMVTVAK